MNRRSFLTGALALAAVAAMPVKAKPQDGYPMTDGEWYDMKIIGDRGLVTLYVNGKSAGTIRPDASGFAVRTENGHIVLRNATRPSAPALIEV